MLSYQPTHLRLEEGDIYILLYTASEACLHEDNPSFQRNNSSRTNETGNLLEDYDCNPQVLENLQEKQKKDDGVPNRSNPLSLPLSLSLSARTSILHLRFLTKSSDSRMPRKGFLVDQTKLTKTGDLIETLDQLSSQELETPSSRPFLYFCLSVEFLRLLQITPFSYLYPEFTH